MNLWEDLDKIAAFIKKNPIKVLMLDFDGTIASIASTPMKARLSEDMKKLLIKLNKIQKLYLVIMSGRGLEDLKSKIKIPNIIYAGNHGLEGEVFDKNHSFPIPNKISLALENILKKLHKIVNEFPGILIEDKRGTISFHYRLADKQQIPKIKSLFERTIKSYIQKSLVIVIPGKMVFDIRPNVNWNKGSFAKLVINQIRKQINITPAVFFIGDDKTDEDVFRQIKNGITVKVGGTYETNAKYRLRNTKEVYKFLKWIEKQL